MNYCGRSTPDKILNVRRLAESILMAIFIEFVNLIIPIATIERCSAVGGFQGFLRSRASEFGNKVGELIWHDEYLCRVDGSMTTSDIPLMIDIWEQRGLRAYVGEGEERAWADMCVVLEGLGLRSPRCAWLTVDASQSWAWHTGFPEGERVGPPRAFEGEKGIS
jgi:hypothetical protein